MNVATPSPSVAAVSSIESVGVAPTVTATLAISLSMAPMVRLGSMLWVMVAPVAPSPAPTVIVRSPSHAPMLNSTRAGATHTFGSLDAMAISTGPV